MSTVSAESFIKNPEKYLSAALNAAIAVDTERGGVVILNASEYEELDMLRCIRQGKADIKAGKTYTHEEVFKEIDEMLKEIKARQN